MAEKKNKIIIFGSHDPDDIYTDHRKEVKCSLCDENMTINIGMYPDDKAQFNVPPPEKYDLAFAKECFVDLAKVVLRGAEVSERYLSKS